MYAYLSLHLMNRFHDHCLNLTTDGVDCDERNDCMVRKGIDYSKEGEGSNNDWW